MSFDLYYDPMSAPCRAVMLTAKTLRLNLNLIPLQLMQGEHLKSEFIKLNPQHTIPTLVDNGFSLWESRAIMTYLASKYGKNDTLYPKDPKKRAIVDQRLYFDIGTLFARCMDYFYPQFRGEQPDDDKKTKLQEALKFLDKFLMDQVYVAGDKLTVADLSIVASVSTIEAIGIDLSEYKNVIRWFNIIKETVAGYEEINGKGIEKLEEMLKNMAKK